MLLLGGAALLYSADVRAQQELPPISWVCPMPEDDVNEAGPGRCPICGMDLIPVRLDLAYSCPNHPAVITTTPGACPIDRRELVQVVVALHWECGPDGQRFTEPGACPGGGERRLVRELRAHGDHNPRHGGLFYMAADNWHHLEGTYPSAGFFRLYFYDNFTKAIEAKPFSGRVAVLDQQNQEQASFPLTVSRDSRTLEARVKAGPPPVRLAALVRLKPDTPEQRFDFPMQAYSREPATAPTPASTSRPPTTSTETPQRSMPALAAAQAPVTGAAQPSTADTMPAAAQAMPSYMQKLTSCEPNMSRTDVLLVSDLLPTETKELLSLLHMCGEEIRKLIEAGQFGFVYQPTMLGKDIGLALENHMSSLNAQQRRVAADAIRRLVVVAWRLDMYGDLGNMIRLKEAYDQFSSAIADLEGAYGSQQ
jgi:hypothetical protein